MSSVISKIIAILITIAYFIALGFGSDFWGNILSPTVTFIASIYLFQAYRKSANKRNKLAYLIGMLAVLGWLVSDIMWLLAKPLANIDPEEHNLFSQFYSITNLFLFIFVLFKFRVMKRWNRVLVATDTIALSLCLMILVWVLFLDQNMQNLLLVQQDITVSFSLVMDYLIFSWIAVWYFSARKSSIHLGSRLLSAALVIYVICDIYYYYEYLLTTYTANTYVDGVYVISFLMLGFGAVIKVNAKEEMVEQRGSYQNVKGQAFLLVIAPILIIIFKGFLLEYLLILVSIIMLYQFLVLYIQRNILRDFMLEEEYKLNHELEIAVEERTKELKELAYQDLVTKLYNRKYLVEKLREFREKLHKNEKIVLFYIDINRYKMLKTIYGNQISEQLLAFTGKKLKNMKAISDTANTVLAMYGEDVFVYAKMGQFSEGEVEALAGEIIEQVSTRYQVENYEIMVSVNIGISNYPDDSDTIEKLISHGTIAMNRARIEGYNRFQLFDHTVSASVLMNNRVELLLKNSNFDQEFYLDYQPQVLSHNKELVGVEALLRWKLKTGEMLSPAVFIPIAEETGIIVPLGYWIIDQVFRQMKEWKLHTGVLLPVAINISAKQLIQKDFVEKFKTLLTTYEMNPDYVEIEITESIQLEANVEIKNSLQELKKLGISIAIDDFGTGYSSLYYIKHLNIDRIKIAKELVDHVVEDEFDATIIKSIINIAEVGNIAVIAEGVETKEQWECLRDLGCEQIQGYYFSRPLSYDTIQNDWIITKQ